MSGVGEKTIKQQDKDSASQLEVSPVVAEARRRFVYCENWESKARKLWQDDNKFANADSDNNYQWPDDVYADRAGVNGSNQPCLTINKTRQHNLQIINEAKKNKPGIRYSATGNDATAESAQVLNGLARHIEQQSNATAHYGSATKNMVDAGWGFWRVQTDYAGTENFDQEIYIGPVQNALNAWLDPTAKEPDQCDAKYGFVGEEISQEQLELKYPRYARYAKQTLFDGIGLQWYRDGVVRVMEYYRLQPVEDTLFAYIPQGKAQPMYIRKSELAGDLLAKVKLDPNTKSRTIFDYKLEWYFIIGNQIAEQKKLAGSIIPLVQVRGEPTIIDGKYDCKGHTRALKDPQRMYNYWSSSAVEYGALQTKIPWLASKEAIEGSEGDFNSANISNLSVLTYNALADDGITKLDKPERIAPPVAAPVALDGMKIAAEEMMTASGQYQAMMGAPSNERSAKAINERQAQGDTATYHYIDAVAQGIRKTGKIILELVPVIYDTQRVVAILQENGKTVDVMIDPAAKKVWETRSAESNQAIKGVLNPQLGKYLVNADVGPSYGTRREEAFNAFMQLLGQAPQLISVLGDILFQAGDFPMAEEAADRLRRLVPPQALGLGPSPSEQQLQQQVQNLKTMLQELMQENAKKILELKGKDQQKVVDMYNSITQRLKVVLADKQVQLNAMELDVMRGQVLHELFAAPIESVGDAAEPVLQQAAQAGGGMSSLQLDKLDQLPPQQGARPGAYGGFFARDYTANPNFRRIG